MQQQPADRKKQDRLTLDSILSCMVESGKIYAGAFKKHWRSLQPYINLKRLEHFLRARCVKLTKKAYSYIAKVDKTLARELSPDLILKS